MTKTVLNVGQCSYDHGQISRMLQAGFDVQVEAAGTFAATWAAVERQAYDLILINRVLDRDGASGLDLVKELKAKPATAEIPVMLVSNYADAQDSAVQLGALPGFGKSDLGTKAVTQRLASVLGS